MQPYFFPYIGYFQILALSDAYVFYDDAQFIKGGWINRNYILVNKQKNLLTLGLRDASPNKNINEIELVGGFKKQLKTIQMAYAKAPNKDAVIHLLDRIFGFSDLNLARFVANSIRETARYLDINTEFHFSSNLEKDLQADAQTKVIQMCHALGGTDYYNPIGGKELYDRDEFSKEKLNLHLLKSTSQPYAQRADEFVPNLSIIDVLMNNDKQAVQEMLTKYELE